MPGFHNFLSQLKPKGVFLESLQPPRSATTVVPDGESGSMLTLQILLEIAIGTSLPLQIIPRYTDVVIYKYIYTKMNMTA